MNGGGGGGVRGGAPRTTFLSYSVKMCISSSFIKYHLHNDETKSYGMLSANYPKSPPKSSNQRRGPYSKVFQLFEALISGLNKKMNSNNVSELIHRKQCAKRC